MAWNKMSKHVVLLFALIFIACGGDVDNESSSVEAPQREVATVFEIGACDADRNGDTVLVLDKSVEYLCAGNNWIDITTLLGNTSTYDSSLINYSSKTDLSYVSPTEVQTIYDLGVCTEKRENTLILVLETGMGYVCHFSHWQQMAIRSSSNALDDSDVASSDSQKSEVPSSSTFDDPLCGSCGSSSSAKLAYVEVATKEKLGNCDTTKINLRTLVLADSSYYTCKMNGWVKDTVYQGYETVSVRVNLPNCNEGNTKQRVLVKQDSIFFVCSTGIWNPETQNGYVINKISVMGSAHKGPFKFNSPLELREVLLRNDTLSYSGRKYIDEISSNAGDFVIPKVSMIYPYAVLEVRGIWRNEVTGEWSKDTMTLRALTELSSKVNVNLLTHLEYDRAINLIKKGYSVSAAKTQADYEIMTAFEITPTMSNSEAKETFGSEADPTLLAMATLFIGNRSDSEISKAINSFKMDIADDGLWNDAKTKAEMADWAESFDYSVVRANVKSWNITAIPEFETQLRTFWYNAYGLGGCGQNRYEVVAPVTNPQSANYNVHYICKSSGWKKATNIEKDTYQWPEGNEGQVKKGDVTDTYYVYENGKWRASADEVENNIGACVSNRLNEVAKSDDIYYTCKLEGWVISSTLEYDTYGWKAGTEGEVKEGSVDATNHYVYENGVWRESADEIEYEIGACVVGREGENIILSNNYYICENNVWKNISEEEYSLGYCSSTNEGVVVSLNGVYYICKSSDWIIATTLEYDSYGLTCSKDGLIVDGNVISENKYVCDADTFRMANDTEISLGVGCVCFTENKIIRVPISAGQDSVYICQNGVWIKSVGQHVVVYGSVLDERDQKTYKTVVIGGQTWMAENLNYETTDSRCYENLESNCSIYGRLYRWSAAVDSLGEFSLNGKGCGYGTTCSLNHPVRGICPKGWHLPDTTEWNELFTEVGGIGITKAAIQL